MSTRADAPPAGEATPTDWRVQFRRALVFIRPDAWMTLAILALTLAGAAASAFEPLLMKAVFDQLAARDAWSVVGMSVVVLLAVNLGREGLAALSNWLTWRVRLRVHHRMLSATVDRLHSLPLTYHREQSVGAMMTRLDRGISGYIGALTEFAFHVVPSVAYLALAIVLMLQLDWRLSLLVLAFAPLPAVIGTLAAREQTRRERILLDRWAAIYGRFNEVLSGIVTVKSFAKEDEEKTRFLTDVQGANEVVARGVRRDSGVGAVKNLVATLARIAALAFGGFLVLQGEVTLGTLIAFLGYIGGLFGPVQGLTSIYQTVRRASVSLEVIFGILDAQDKLGDAPEAVEIGHVEGRVTFENVSFGYSPDKPLLRDVSFDVRPGETVALVGPSGSGKTTLMALLQRLYDPVSGAVRVDGRDLREIRQRSLRKQIGVVLQDALLFNDTVRNAIAYARPEATHADIEAVARAAHAHAFVSALPQGYDTLVGERGSRLSVGERQRIAIARALLKDPRILILDEATSALDAESESLVQEALGELCKGRTTFIIAHRLATVVKADRILVLKGGRIVESGNHQELMRLDGTYAMLVRHQTGGLIATADG